VEVKFSSNFLDNGQMVYDFGLMKQNLKDLIEIFDHSITLWNKDDSEYIKQMKKHSARWVELPVSPSAEQFARVIFVLCDSLMQLTTTINGEKEVKVHSIVVHETDSGYAEAFRDDAYNKNMGEIKLEEIKLSQAIIDDFKDKELWSKLLNKQKFINPDTI
jgi:6-pyruvoyltetrahydropterin/6-carboxytetrahydropterin synthase